MHFSVNIYVTSGKGGNGYFDFSRKLMKKMDGGNGGNGGNVYIFASKKINNLDYFINGFNYKAENGFDGKKGKKNGKNGKDLKIYVPLGTKVFDNESNNFLGLLDKDESSILVACGGTKGLGSYSCRKNIKNLDKNISFGSLPEVKFLRLEFDLFSDIAIFGFPNVGKSTFLNRVANSKYKASDYSFTTLSPNIGVLKLNNRLYRIIDFPGMVKDASKGVGLGLDFLKHLSGVKLLFHFMDLSVITNRDSFINELNILNFELRNINKDFSFKEKWLILNKSDLVSYKFFFIDYRLLYKYNYKRFFFISSKNITGIKKLCYNLIDYV